jgi:plasmid stability protein
MGRLVRKQVYLTEAQDRLLKQAAAHERKTEAEIIRSALDQRLRPWRAPRRSSAADPLWKILGLGRSGVRDVSQEVVHYLYGAPKR